MSKEDYRIEVEIYQTSGYTFTATYKEIGEWINAHNKAFTQILGSDGILVLPRAVREGFKINLIPIEKFHEKMPADKDPFSNGKAKKDRKKDKELAAAVKKRPKKLENIKKRVVLPTTPGYVKLYTPGEIVTHHFDGFGDFTMQINSQTIHLEDGRDIDIYDVAAMEFYFPSIADPILMMGGPSDEA